MSFVVAIGGVDVEGWSTRVIDQQILDLTGEFKPNVLFLPTASEDDEAYIHTFTDYYQRLGAVVSVLEVAHGLASTDEIQEKVGSAHAVYAGGGDMLTLLDGWSASGVDDELMQRVNSAVVFSGQSAGANCWFEYASSNSRRADEPENVGYRKINGLPIVRDMIVSPHFYTERDARTTALVEQLEKLPPEVRGLGIDDHAAYIAEISDGNVIQERHTSNVPGLGARTFRKHESGLLVETVAPRWQARP